MQPAEFQLFMDGCTARQPRARAGVSETIAGRTDGAENIDLSTGLWEHEMEWCLRAFLSSVDASVLRSALDTKRLYDSCSHKANIGERDEEAEDKAEEEADARAAEVDVSFAEAQRCLYFPLKIEVIRAVERKIPALREQAGGSVQDPAHMKKVVEHEWEAVTRDCGGATAVDRVLVRTGNGFRLVQGPARRALVDSLAQQVLLSPNRPSAAEVRRPWAGTISHPKHPRLF